jgi:hypothetical protein
MCLLYNSGFVSDFRISDIIAGKLELTSVSSALILAAGIGIMEALALFLGSGLFLKLMGVSPVCLNYDLIFMFSLCVIGNNILYCFFYYIIFFKSNFYYIIGNDPLTEYKNK